jgi:hypothetical protein
VIVGDQGALDGAPIRQLCRITTLSAISRWRMRSTAWPAQAGRSDDVAGRLRAECGQESVQAGDHDDCKVRRVQTRRSWGTFRVPVSDELRRVAAWSSPATCRVMKTNSRPGRPVASAFSQRTPPPPGLRPATSRDRWLDANVQRGPE